MGRRRSGSHPVGGAPEPAATVEAGAAAPARTVAALFVAVILAAAFLIFFRLDQRLLWVDEAETALLGRNILIYGVPKAFDGKTLISQEAGRDYGADYLWRWTPWLEKYLAAASFAVLGESTLAARLPFALLGLLAVASLYPLALILFRDRWIGLLAMAFLTVSVPFLLHVRQCRYYSPIILSSIWALYFFVRLGRGQRGGVAGFAAAMTLLFHSNNLTFAATAAALAPWALSMRFERGTLRRTALSAGLILLLNVPWALYLIQGKVEERLYSFSDNFRFLLELTSRYTFPIAVLPLFLALAWLLRAKHPLLEARAWRPFLALIVFAAAYLVAMSAAPWCFYRYTVNLLPLSALLLAVMCRGVLRRSRIAGAAFTACLLFTGLFSQLSAWPLPPTRSAWEVEGRSFPIYDFFFPLGNYLHEVTHAFAGPMERLLAYLSQNARPEERIFITYGDLVLKFYTDHEVRGGLSGQTLSGWPEPEWVILRSFFRFGDRPELRADAERMLAWLNNEVPPHHYQEVAAPWMDFPWDNAAEPQFHWFRVPSGGKPMQIFRRKALPAVPAP